MQRSEASDDAKQVLQVEDYLSQGFFTANLQLRAGINGAHSLAMAKRCRSENISAEKLKVTFQSLHLLLDEQLDASIDDAEKLSDKVYEKLRRFALGQDVQDSPLLSEFFALSPDIIKHQRDLRALLQHLERIMVQLSLLSALAESPEEMRKLVAEHAEL